MKGILNTIFFTVLVFFSWNSFGQCPTTIPFSSGSGTFTVPAGVNSITVETWGGGGRGGNRNNNGEAGGGGGGGYSMSVISVNPGDVYTYAVGPGSTSNLPGGNSEFYLTSNPAIILVRAIGGNSVADNSTTGATGGALGIGGLRYSGGNGSNVASGNGGGGGSSASPTSNGINSTSSTGSIIINGGDGGNGATSNADGNPGSAPGGGGGGTKRNGSNGGNGGAGGSGEVKISYSIPSAVGAVSANQTICNGSSPANMTIANATGTIQWQRADNLAFTTNVTNVGTNSTTLTSAQVGALTATRYFRAVVTNGTCTSINSAIITVTVDSPSAVGAVSANQTICSGSSPANMTIASATGTIQWQRADNLAFTTNVTNVGANSTTLTSAQVGALTATRYFRAVVTNGTCTAVNSPVITVSVDAPSAVGAVSADQTICSGSSPANITIASATGSIQWQRADNLAFTTNVTNIGTNATTLTTAQVGALTATRYFRAVVTNGTCTAVNSPVITVTVDAPSAVGAVSADQTICSGSSPANMTIANATGTIQWQRADNLAFTTNVTNIGTNSTTLTSAQVGALTTTRYFRAVVTNGTCISINSAIITVTVDSPSSVGAVSADQKICSDSSPANMTIASATGTIQWQRADNLAFTTNVTNIGTNSTTLTSAQVGALTATRYFRAVVSNGTCTAVNSPVITVTIDSPSAVGSVSADQTICSGSSPATMTIASATGTIQWQRADNLAFTTNVTNIGTNSTTLTTAQVGALSATRYFRAMVTNGACTSVNSGIITVTVNPATNIDTENLEAQSICIGQNFTPISVTATGTGSLTYQWYSNVTSSNSGGTLISNANSDLYTPPSSGIGTLYYYVEVSGDCGSSTSKVSGAFIVDPITSITLQPDSLGEVECFGDGFFTTLSISAIGGGLTYQWYKNSVQSNSGGIAIPGENSPNFTPPSTPVGSTYYYAVVTGNCGVETSTVSGEYIVTPPKTIITQDPNNTPQTVCLGDSFTSLSVLAIGEGTVNYKWYRNTSAANFGGILIPGETNPNFTPTASNVGTTYYYGVASSDCGTVPTQVSGAFTVTPLTTVNTENLSAQTICFGDTFSPISVNATGTGTLSYQWYSNTANNNLTGSLIGGATSSSYSPPSSSVGTTYYYVIVSSDCGPDIISNVSGAQTINSLPIPTFTTAPSASICVNSSVTYTTQPGQLNYSWSGFGTEGIDYTITSGGIEANNNSVTVTWLTSGAKNVSVLYRNSNNCTAVVPATSLLTVNPLPTPTFITAPSSAVCVGTSVTYTTQSGAGQSNYIWNISGISGTDYNITAGGTQTSNPSVTLTWLTAGAKNVSVIYTNSNNCTATAPSKNTLTVNPLPVPTFIVEPGSLVCVQSDVIYTTQPGKSNYVWTLPGILGVDFAITSGGTGNTNSTVTVQWLTPGSKNVTVRYSEPTTGCVATTTATSTTAVESFATVGLTSVSFPSVCITSPILTPFTQATTGVTAIGTPTGLPPGISASFNSSNGIITFSGTATTTGLYSYSIPLTGNCINGLNATGTIDVTPVYEITAVSSVSATTVGGSAFVTFYGNPLTMLNGTYHLVYQIKQASGSFTSVGPVNATVVNGKGTFGTIPITSNEDTYTVQILSIKKSTDVCTVILPTPPTTYFGVCSAVFGGSSTFHVPANVYSITIEVYGGGGGGDNGGGGGGGYTIRQNIPVTPGEPLAVFVGNGGGKGATGGNSYVTRDSNIANQLNNSLVFAYGGNRNALGNFSQGVGASFDPRFSGSNGSNTSGNTGGAGGGPLGGNGGTSGAHGSPPGGGGGRWSGTRGQGGNGLVIISYSCPDADITDCIKVIDDGSKSGTTVIEFVCDYVWTAPEGLVGFTTVVGSAGGGGGSGEGSGGGGSGSLIQQTFSTNNPYGLPPGSNYTIVVGQGGLGATGINNSGFNGAPSSLSGSIDGNPINISVPGGGGGGSQSANTGGSGSSGGGGGASPAPAKSEGSGGNAMPITYSGSGVIIYQGNPGGAGDYSEPQNSVAGGGGGGLTPWKPAPSNDGQNGKAAGNGQGEGGRGGDGIAITLGDSTRYFGAGGGGIGRYFNGTDKIGLGGSANGVRFGGNGNLSGTNPVGGAGLNKTGSGGGAGYFGGGRGGNGIVYVYFDNYRILPVEYLYFNTTYDKDGRSGNLAWATAQEWENSHFEIERSLNGVSSWTKMGEKQGQGYSEIPSEYTFTDNKLPASGGIAYYRLKQVNFDGKFSYSVTKSIQVEGIKGNGAWIAYPNPSSKKSTVSVDLLNRSVYNDEKILIQISDIRGVVETFTVNQIESVSEVVNSYLDRSNQGIYILQLIWGNNAQQLKLLRE